MGWQDDKETGICTCYELHIEGIEVDFNCSWCPGAAISLYNHDLLESGKRKLLFTTIDCPKVLHLTPAKLYFLWHNDVVEIEYWEDGYMRREVLATGEEADEIASRAVYDEWGNAHIVVTRTLSVGTSTVWLKGSRKRWYHEAANYNVRLVVEFGNSEECTRFLHEDMRKLKLRDILDVNTDVAVINDIMRALVPIRDDLDAAEKYALRHTVPLSQFQDECSQPKTQLIRHRGSNRGDDRPCYLTLHISTTMSSISNVDWSATTIPPTLPLRSDAFRSLNSLHLKFPSPASQDRNPNSSSQSHQDDLTITISAREISFSTSTDTVSLGNGFTLSSEHRTVNVNYINAIMGDAFLAPISGGTIGGRNNVNNSFSMRTDEGASMLNDLRSINDLANSSLAGPTGHS